MGHMVHATETEQKIIASAEKLFYRKGKAGTSMQDIADDAGINRTLLNYYFRTKDQLFEAVFRDAMSRVIPELARLLKSGITFSQYLPQMIEKIIDTMLENPQIPIFVLQELSSNPERMPRMVKEMGIDPDLALEKISAEQDGNGSTGLDPRQIILNMLSLIIFPFAARPVVTEFLFGGSEEEYRAAMMERKALIPNIIRQFIHQRPTS